MLSPPITIFLEKKEMKLLNNLKDGFIYAITAIKNRYPCKIDTVHFFNEKRPTEIEYRVLNRLDVRTSNVHEIILNDSLLEKFHPADALKLGVVLVGDVLFQDRKCMTHEDLHEKYKSFCTEILGAERKL